MLSSSNFGFNTNDQMSKLDQMTFIDLLLILFWYCYYSLIFLIPHYVNIYLLFLYKTCKEVGPIFYNPSSLFGLPRHVFFNIIYIYYHCLLIFVANKWLMINCGRRTLWTRNWRLWYYDACQSCSLPQQLHD